MGSWYMPAYPLQLIYDLLIHSDLETSMGGSVGVSTRDSSAGRQPVPDGSVVRS